MSGVHDSRLCELQIKASLGAIGPPQEATDGGPLVHGLGLAPVLPGVHRPGLCGPAQSRQETRDTMWSRLPRELRARETA